MSAHNLAETSELLPPTPGQTIGPFYGFALPFERGGELVPTSHPGAIRVFGTIYDGDGVPVPDAIVELWQQDAHGAVPKETGSFDRDGYTFTGFGRTPVNGAGTYQFVTVAPGVAAGQSHAPFMTLTIFGRGLMNKLHTRIYLPGSALLDTDPLLVSLGERERSSMIATEVAPGQFQLDIHLQGPCETVFLAYQGFSA